MTALNVLATRYASPQMREIWSAESKVRAERDLWIAVMHAQQIEPSVIADYERVTRHDVKARIEEFNALAGHQRIHAGMTSRDLTENVEQMQVRRAVELVRDRTVAALALVAERAAEFDSLPIAGRSHNVPAQVTTLGKRFASCGEELLYALERIEQTLTSYPMRGIKGPVGTSQDMLDLLGDVHEVDLLEQQIARHLGFDRVLDSVGQVYPRSLDFDVISALVLLAAAPSSFALSVRLMAGAELVSEGFAEGQTGSSAMPHKMNTRSCERINGLAAILKGHLTMASSLAGDQWNEGDVSCSVVRRVALPDAFYAIDGLLETFMTVLMEFTVFPHAIESELQRLLPFLGSTRILMAAIKAGAGREQAHEVIKEHSVAVAKAMRTSGSKNDLVSRLGADPRLPLNQDEIDALLNQPLNFTGNAARQTQAVVERIHGVLARHHEAASYRPTSIL